MGTWCNSITLFAFLITSLFIFSFFYCRKTDVTFCIKIAQFILMCVEVKSLREECGVAECHKRIIHYVRNAINIPHNKEWKWETFLFLTCVVLLTHEYTIALFIPFFEEGKSISCLCIILSYKYVFFAINDILLA